MGRRKRKMADGEAEKTPFPRKRGNNYYNDCRKGFYHLVNPGKYMFEGTTEVEYKSGWERDFFPVCDGNERVVRWGYEPFEIPYSSPALMKQSLYRPDVYLEMLNEDGNIEKWLIEIKPVAYSIVPTPPRPLPPGCQDQKKMASYQKRLAAYQRKCLDVATNFAKWEAAEAWCRRHQVNWMIFNEENTRGLFKRDKSK